MDQLAFALDANRRWPFVFLFSRTYLAMWAKKRAQCLVRAIGECPATDRIVGLIPSRIDDAETIDSG